MQPTEKDKKLIAKARRLHYTDWMEAEKMIQQAESDYARQELHDISTRLYHIEEYAGGNL